VALVAYHRESELQKQAGMFNELDLPNKEEGLTDEPFKPYLKPLIAL
jgi:hypothetical protein